MKIVALIQIILGLLLCVAAPVSSENGIVIMIFLFLVGGLAIAGSMGLLIKKRWGILLSAVANFIFLVPMLWLSGEIVRDLIRHETSLESSGRYFFLAPLVPAVILIYLFRHRRSC